MKAFPPVRRLSPLILFMVLALATLLTPVAYAGSSTNPEIRDPGDDSRLTLGTVSQPWEITKGWIAKEGEILVFTLELLGSPEAPPTNAAYTWHYTWDAYRFYWMMNMTEAGPTYSGGVYQGTPNTDRYGSSQYRYISSPALGANLTGGFEGGPNARITWRYDANNFGKPGEEPIFFSGMAAYSYQVGDRNSDGANKCDDDPRAFDAPAGLRDHDLGCRVMIDAATGDDYIYIVLLPWHERLWRQVPGPSPVAVVLGAMVLLAMAARSRRSA